MENTANREPKEEKGKGESSRRIVVLNAILIGIQG